MPRLKTKTYEVVDQKALFDAYPHLFGVVPDHAKVRAAIRAGFKLPGVKLGSGEVSNVEE